jgi:catechol 2,3-dioxygenase-like lactoylglutathione lyase family enzyme
MKLDHVTIRTLDLQGTRSFFLTVFELEEGERPLAIRRIPGHWLYSEGRPLVHIIASQENGIDRAAEAIDHAGLRMEGYAEFRKKLDQLGIRYTPMDLADLQERRLFFHGKPLYRWGDSLAWAESLLTEPRRSTSEQDVAERPSGQTWMMR